MTGAVLPSMRNERIPNSASASARPAVNTQRPQDSASPAERKDDIPRGIFFMIAASLLFAASNAIAKWVVALYPVGEVMFFRSFSSLIVCSIFVLPVTGFAVFATKRPRDHIARGVSQSISQTFTVIALMLMPLAGAIAINFSAPLFSALISIIFLKERAGAVRWTALIAGFLGVLIVTDPGADSLQIGALFALANAVMYGSVTVAVRGMSKTESANTLLMWQMITLAFFHSFLLFFGFKWPTPMDATLLVGSGVVNAAAQYFWTRALHIAPATAVSPFYYFMLVWALLIGFVVWGDVPTSGLLIGSSIVVASGLFLLRHESRLKAVAQLEVIAAKAAQFSQMQRGKMATDTSMIPKNGNRLSEKIMLKQGSKRPSSSSTLRSTIWR